jgi:hypothetical protein
MSQRLLLCGRNFVPASSDSRGRYAHLMLLVPALFGALSDAIHSLQIVELL